VSCAIACALRCVRVTVQVRPSQMKPNNSLLGAQQASPASSFLVEIGTLPFVCPDRCGAGNRPWIVCSAAQLVRARAVPERFSTGPGCNHPHTTQLTFAMGTQRPGWSGVGLGCRGS
jgi:hypothetical protein